MQYASTCQRSVSSLLLARRLAPLIALLIALLVPQLALADAPITRGPERHGQGQGSVGSPPVAAGEAGIGAVWRDVRELSPLALPLRGSAALRPQGQSGEESGPITWLGRNLNPGNWILDAGMGIFAGIVKMFGGIMQKAVQAFLGTGSVLPAGCDNAATNFVFCTPASLTYDHPGVKTVWSILSGIGAGLVTILFTVRLGRMVIEGPRTLASEGKSLLLSFLFAMAFIQATHAICKLIIDFFNGISHLLLSRASLALPSQDVGDLNIGSNILFLVLWSIILILIIKSFTRIVQIIILIACAPIAGALLMDRATSSRFRSWFEKLIELLLAQVNLAILFIVITAILQPYQGQQSGDQFVGLLLSIVMMGMALSGRSVIGVAGAALSGGGGGLLAFLRYQVLGSALRRTVGARGARQSRPQLEGQINTPTPSGMPASAARASGDPQRSAAALRHMAGGSATRRPLPAGAFRLADAADSLLSKGGGARYQAAGHLGQATSNRREQALLRATLLRQRADALREAGDRTGAEHLKRKARLQERFGHGQEIARPARFSPAERATRRETYRHALNEVAGMHALERDTLVEQIGQDAARLPQLQRALALAGATGGDTSGMHREHQEIALRLEQRRARLRAILPAQAGRPTPTTRAAAAALANERLPQALRSPAYALRFGTADASPFVRRVAGAPSQDARDELAQTRARTVTLAQTRAKLRPPLTARRPAAKGRVSSNPTPPTQDALPAHPSRARSQTIALLRERRRALPNPSAPDTPRVQRPRSDDAEG